VQEGRHSGGLGGGQDALEAAHPVLEDGQVTRGLLSVVELSAQHLRGRQLLRLLAEDSQLLETETRLLPLQLHVPGQQDDPSIRVRAGNRPPVLGGLDELRKDPLLACNYLQDSPTLEETVLELHLLGVVPPQGVDLLEAPLARRALQIEELLMLFLNVLDLIGYGFHARVREEIPSKQRQDLGLCAGEVSELGRLKMLGPVELGQLEKLCPESVHFEPEHFLPKLKVLFWEKTTRKVFWMFCDKRSFNSSRPGFLGQV
jgi:hypothetical protein